MVDGVGPSKSQSSLLQLFQAQNSGGHNIPVYGVNRDKLVYSAFSRVFLSTTMRQTNTDSELG